jgi:hypothetical protein
LGAFVLMLAPAPPSPRENWWSGPGSNPVGGVSDGSPPAA